MTIREHLLLGNEAFGTLVTGCGSKPKRIRDEWVLGPSRCSREDEYVRLRHMCGRCESAWRKICRDRNQKWVPTRHDHLRSAAASRENPP